MRWDDHGYTEPSSYEIPVMKQRPEDNRHGYVVHDACWRLLQKASEPHDIPLVRLYKICSSLPFPIQGIGVSWGHNYGGVSIIDNQNFYPWEDRLIEQFSRSETYQHATFNPYDIPELPDLLSMLPRKNHDYRGNLGANSNNCFSVLPWEIREAIAIYLSTNDVANLLMSSKAFLPFLTSQTFWSSRFQIGGERESVFETRVRQQQPKDWISLYQMTNDVQSPPGLKNRMRIWTLIKPLVNLRLRTPSPWTVAADTQEDAVPNAFFYEGCRLLQTQTTTLPSDLVGIAFSVTGEENGYLTGMRFISQDCSHICLGYITEGKELHLDITTIKGFVLAMGSRGIQALQVVHGDGKVSKWVGCPKNSLVTERLLGCEAGYKIVRLSIARQGASNIAKPISRNSSLRETAIWFPTIPLPNLCLNDESFTGENPLTAGYHPLIWTQFGGPNGVHLRSLTEICVTCLGNLCSIEFHYDRTDTETPETQVLGRRTVTDFSDTMKFAIDGPGGEFVQSVAVSLKRLAWKIDLVEDFDKSREIHTFSTSR
ncbi:hypothetical protein UA08_08708 [Talaromyces atroroseus]|uniref:DUF7600 domain-containing protein n=1 Tax=Talaromyces atroroseus TaxID=1441469 RepID=A0A225ABG7_TALAT|nr:hypothetical protein UA08_08708 [Talaromyces atroroseus]OKL56123.1 hypothetical protein UA08_08708 [Talaromyces atroroseus]